MSVNDASDQGIIQERFFMAYLSHFDPPLLDAKAGTLRGHLELGLVCQGRQPPHNKAMSRLLTAYLIVVDKAIREYRAGCEKILKNMTSGGVGPYVEGTGHFETCINSTKRAMRLLQRLVGASEGLTADRQLRRSIAAWERQLTDIRDAVEHIDSDILSDRGIEEGMAHLLTISDDGQRLEIADHSLPLAALHSTISSLHAAGGAMIESLPSPTPPTN
jgi:hypothetical protein